MVKNKEEILIGNGNFFYSFYYGYKRSMRELERYKS